MMPATVRIPPTIAHVDVKKCAMDWRVSRWMTSIGEISYCAGRCKGKVSMVLPDSSRTRKERKAHAKEDAWDASKAVACRMPGFLRRAVPFAEIALVAGDAVLVSLERLPAERLKARRDDLQEILKHVVALLCVRLDAVQWVDDAQAALEPLRLGRCGAEVLFLAAKVEAVHDVSEIVVMLALQVGNEIVDVHRVRLEGASRREVEVADAAKRQ